LRAAGTQCFLHEDGMSHAHQDDHDQPHEGPIKTTKQLVWAVVLSFVVPILAILLLANYVTAQKKPAAGADAALGEQAVAERLQKVGRVEIKDVSDPSALKAGKDVYAAQCAACHATGAANAPKLGDAAAWAPRIKTGYDALLTSALKGKGSMGAQGGGDFSDLEIGRAVVYMANQAGGTLPEPKGAPAAAAAAAEPAAAAAPAAAPAPSAAPAAQVAAAAPAAVAAADAVPALYNQVCAACHLAGVANAPKLGDKAAWGPRLAAGVDGLTASVVKGKGAMPPKGGAAAASDADIKAVVAYMVGTVK
jgi:cytochrome c5